MYTHMYMSKYILNRRLNYMANIIDILDIIFILRIMENTSFRLK